MGGEGTLHHLFSSRLHCICICILPARSTLPYFLPVGPVMMRLIARTLRCERVSLASSTHTKDPCRGTSLPHPALSFPLASLRSICLNQRTHRAFRRIYVKLVTQRHTCSPCWGGTAPYQSTLVICFDRAPGPGVEPSVRESSRAEETAEGGRQSSDLGVLPLLLRVSTQRVERVCIVRLLLVVNLRGLTSDKSAR